MPLIASQLAIQSQNVIEVMLAGHAGARVLAAVAIGANLFSLPLMAMIGTLYAVPASVAQLAGAGRQEEVAGLLRQAVHVGLALGLIMMSAVGLVAPLLVRAVGLDAALTVEATRFLHAIAFAMPGIGVFVACRGVSDGLSTPRTALAFMLMNLALLGPLGWTLLYGHFGLPALGAAGLGVASAVLNAASATGLLLVLRLSRRYRHIGWGRPGASWRPDWDVIGGLLRVGLPMGVSVSSEVGLFSLSALLVGRFGVAAAGAHQIALNVAALAFMVPLGLASAITVRVGLAAGAGDVAAARRAGLAGCGLAVTIQLLPFAVMLSAPRLVAGLYTPDAAVIATAAGLLRIAAIFQFSDGLQVAASGALRGLKDTRLPMLLTLLAYWGVGMPVGVLLGFGAGMGARGVWIGLTAGLTAAAVLLLGRFLRRTRSAMGAGVPSTFPPRASVS